MEDVVSFVDVRHVFAEYSLKNSLVDKIIGRAGEAHSVLRDVSFELAHGTHAVLFGLSASGKTTLLRLLSGAVNPSQGRIYINGKKPQDIKSLAAGYVSSEESEPQGDTVREVLHAFGTTHGTHNLPARIGELTELLNLGGIINRSAKDLASTERLRVNVARAALSDSPLVLLDDTADELGSAVVKKYIKEIFAGRTVIIATRFAATAEHLDLPILLLHNAKLAQYGTKDELAAAMSCPHALDAWIEGLRYDLLRKLKGHPGVLSVRLLSTTHFAGQRLRIVLRSTRYLPSMYDIISQASLVKVQEIPPSLGEILARL